MPGWRVATKAGNASRAAVPTPRPWWRRSTKNARTPSVSGAPATCPNTGSLSRTRKPTGWPSSSTAIGSMPSSLSAGGSVSPGSPE
jgi:hypothetical protein